MEKFFLCRFLSYNKLDIIDKKYIDISVFFAEFGHSGVISVTDRLDQLICKFFAGNIQNLTVFIMLNNVMSDGMHKVGLAKSGASVDKKRIVGISRRFCNRKGCRLGKFIVVTDDKGIKNIFGIQMSFFAAAVNVRHCCRCGCIIIRRNFFFRGLVRRYKFDFTLFHSGYFTDRNLKKKFILFIKKIY